MDNDEVRKRRVERLARLQQTQSPSPEPAKPRLAPAEPKPQSGMEAPKAGNSRQAASSTSSGSSVSAKASSKRQTSSVAPENSRGSQTPRGPSVAYVFQIPEAEAPKDWHEVSELGFDRILWEKVTSNRVKPLTYLLECFARSGKLYTYSADLAGQLQDAIITMSFLSATADAEDEVHDELGTALLHAAEAGSLDKTFVHRLLQLASEDEEFYPMLLQSIVGSAKKSLEFGAPTTAAIFTMLESTLEAPGTAKLLLRLPAKPHTPTVLADTLLGSVLSVGVSSEGLLKLHSPELISRSSLNELTELAKQTESMTDLLCGCQFRLIQKLVRLGSEERRLVLDWFVAVLDINHGQMAMNRIPSKMNTLQLMLNALKVLLRLAEPFVKLDPASLHGQLKKIRPDYFASSTSYSVDDETKTLASQDSPHNSRNQELPLNFVTECFFICAGFLHFGFHATVQALDGSLKRHAEHLESQVDSMENEPSLRNMPEPLRRATMMRYQNVLRLIKSEYAGLYVEAHNVELMGQVLRFSEFDLAYGVYSAQNCPETTQIRVPWNEVPPDAFASYPEFLIEAPLATASYVLRSVEFLRNPTMSGDNQLLVDASIFFMSSPIVLRNPYLRSKFVEILFYGGADIPLGNGTTMPGSLSTLFTTSQTCRTFLLPALMSVFIDIEHTGRSSQFYEKFTTRELVANVLKVIWRDPHYRSQLVVESEEKPDFFVKFVALLLNDATYLLDEALGKLLEVHKLQHDPGLTEAHASASSGQGATDASTGGAGSAMGDSSSTSEEDAEMGDGSEEGGEAEDVGTRLRNAERSAKNFLQLSSSTMALLNTFTSNVPHIFATPEIIDRFAVMLNYNLAALVGPKCNQLKVQNPAQLGFNPRMLLADLIKVYLNLRNEQPFPKSLSKDERSYRDENFSKAYRILSKFSLLSPIDLDNFADLAKRTRQAWQETQEEDEEFGDDIPDEFLDPLMYDLMSNPVTLPTSKINIDLSTIKTHLLSDPTDPFNRVPLEIEDVIPNPELKQKIDEFKAQKKAKRRQAEAPSANA